MGNPYLVAYNGALFFGWGYVLYLTYKTVLAGGGTADVWAATELPLKVSQTAAILEVVHAATGLVRSPVGITAMQVASRIWCLWGIVNAVPVPTTTSGLPATPLGFIGPVPLQLNLISLLTAWCLSEVIRYGFFALKEAFGDAPYVSTWLRYSGFIALYPLGVASELTMAWLALPALKASRKWSIEMPNAANFAFSYHAACVLTMLTYLPGLPQLYGYMLANRRKVLGGGGGGAAKKAKAS